MKGSGWAVVAKVAGSLAAKRTDSSGDMEQLELMELILVSEHASKSAAEQDAVARRAAKDGWVYAVMTRRDYEAAIGSAKRTPAGAKSTKPTAPRPTSHRPKAA